MKTLILVGSPKGMNSSSRLLGAKLAEGLRNRGAPVSEGMVHQALRSEEDTRHLLEAVDAAGLLVLAFPVYIGALPAPLVRLLEMIADRRARTGAPPGTPRVAALVQCGFPEARQCDTAVALCRLFALRAGMQWAGALAMGMGGQLGGGFEKLPGGGGATLRALDMTAESLATGGDVPAEASKLFARPLVPRWTYTLFGNLGWRAQLRRNGARRRIGYRPFEQG